MAVPIRNKASADIADLINRKFNKDPNKPIVQEDFSLSPPPSLSNVADQVNRSYNQSQLSTVVPRYPVLGYSQPLQTSDVADIINSKFNRNPLKTASDYEMPARMVGLKQYPATQSSYYLNPVPLSTTHQVQTLYRSQSIGYSQPVIYGPIAPFSVPASTLPSSASFVHPGSGSFVGLNQVDICHVSELYS